MKKIVILKAGSTDPDLQKIRGDFEDWIILHSRLPRENFTILPLKQKDFVLHPDACLGVIITGSHDMVTDQPPYLTTAVTMLRSLHAKRIPVLGICFGHQLLAHAFGGQVAENPTGPEYGSVEIVLTPRARMEPLFSEFPPIFKAFMSHRQSIRRLPEGGVSLASSPSDQNAIIYLEPNMWGVQFHPEFDPQIMEHYLHSHFNVPESASPPLLEDTPTARLILSRFVDLCSKNR